MFRLCVLMCVVSSLLRAESVISTSEQRERMQLSIYSNGIAHVQEERQVELGGGNTYLLWKDLSRLVLADSVELRWQGEPNGLETSEQWYRFDQLDRSSILKRAIGHKVRVVGRGEDDFDLEGRLLFTGGGLTLRTDNKLIVGVDGMVFIDPQEFILPVASEPKLEWKGKVNGGGMAPLMLSYLTHGLSWKASYRLDVNGDSGNLSSWITLTNESGLTIEDGEIEVVAGHFRTEQVRHYREEAMMMKSMAADQAPQVESAGIGYAYPLPRKIRFLKDGQSKQVRLLTANEIPLNKEYWFVGYDHAHVEQPIHAEARYQFENEKTNGLGYPLPAGSVRVFEEGRWNGEASIGHIPVKEKVQIRHGQAFDVVGTMKRIRWVKRQHPAKSWDGAWELRIRNRGGKRRKVVVQRNFSGDFTLSKASHRFEKVTDRIIRFHLDLDGGQEELIRYGAQVRWQ